MTKLFFLSSIFIFLSCAKGEYLKCTSDSECAPSGKICSSVTHICELPSNCEPKCSDGYICNEKTGKCESKLTCGKGECPKGQICNEDGRCEITCECPKYETCDEYGKCVSFCSLNGCPEGQTCDEYGKCVPFCSLNGCPEGQTCNIDAGKCVPIDNCSELCENGHCENTGDSYRCICNKGFRNLTEFMCIDIDECENGNHNCNENSHCVNTDGSYKCKCNKWHSGETCEIAHFVTTWKTDNEGASSDRQIIIPTNPEEYEYDYEIDCNSDGTFEAKHVSGNYICNYETLGIYTVSIRGNFPHMYFHHDNYTSPKDNNKLLSVEQWGSINWKSMKEMFHLCRNLVVNAKDVPDLSSVTDMSAMFWSASNFNSDISKWDVSSVTNMSHMLNSTLFNQPLNSWNVSNVIDMSGMLSWLDHFNHPLDSWDVSNVQNMRGIFKDSKSFNQDLSSWRVSSVTNMQRMFENATKFNSDLSSWNVSKVRDMMLMFSGADSFNSNISEWNVSSVTNMSYMFTGADSFNQDLSSWNNKIHQVNSCTFFYNGASSWTLPKPNFPNCSTK